MKVIRMDDAPPEFDMTKYVKLRFFVGLFHAIYENGGVS